MPQAAPKSARASATDGSIILARLNRIAEAERAKDISIIRDTGWPRATFSARGFGEPLARAYQRAWNEPIFSGIAVSAQIHYFRPRIRWAVKPAC